MNGILAWEKRSLHPFFCAISHVISLLIVVATFSSAAWGDINAVTTSFTTASIAAGTITTLTVTITNHAPGNPGSIAFTNNYPAGLTNAATTALTNNCGGTATAAANGNSLSLSSGSINGNNSCTVSVSVTASTAGNYVNPSFTVNSSNNSFASNAATLTATSALILSEYRFDDVAWCTPVSALDSVGGRNGSLVGGVAWANSPVSGSKPVDGAAASFSGASGGAIDITGLPFDLTTGANNSVSFWMYWDGTDNVMPMGFGSHDLWLQGGSFGFNTFSSDIFGISSAGLANGWHHVAAVFNNGNVTSNKLWIDGVSQVLTQRQGAPSSANAVVSAHMRLSGVWGTSGYLFSGKLDVVRVYSGLISQAQVDADRALTYPAVVCPPPPPPTLVAQYQFDDNWDTTHATVNAVSGGPSGTLISPYATRVATPAVLPNKPNTCYGAAFTGATGSMRTTGTSLNLTAGASNSVSFWMYWTGGDSQMPFGFALHDLWLQGGSFGFNSAGGDIFGISSASLANGWHHVAAVFTNGNVGSDLLWIDGVSQVLTQRQGTPSSVNAYASNTFQLSSWTNDNNYRFVGTIDELKVYNGALTNSLVLSDYTTSCVAATKLAFVQQPSNAVAGVANSPAVTVAIQDANGNMVTSNTSTVTLAIGANLGGGTLSGTVSAAAVNGVATFSNLSINNTGTGYTLVASDGALTGATSSSFNITPTPITINNYSFEYPSQTYGNWSNGDVTNWTVTGSDGVWYPDTSSLPQGASDGVQVGWSNGGSLSQTLSTTLAANTQYTLKVDLLSRNDIPNVSSTLQLLAGANVLASSTITGGTRGTNVLQSVSFLSCASSPYVGQQLGITLTSGGGQSDWDNVRLTAAPFTLGTAARLVFLQQPSDAMAGVANNPAVQVAIQDQNGCTMTSNTSTVTLAIGANPGGGTLSGTVSVAAVNGVATFSNLSINNTGTGYTLVASDGALAGATSNAFNITLTTSIPINNFSFEYPQQSYGNWSNGDVTSWTATGSDGVWYPDTSSLPQGATDGVQVGWSNGGSLSQTLTTTLAANTQYTLNVDLLSRNDIPNVLSTLQLLAGGNVLASSTITGGTRGTNVLQTVNFLSGASNPYLGQQLGITLTSGGGQSDWDNVRLTAAPAPLALYHMDEAGWTGASGQVIDGSGNGYNAQAINGATTASSSPPPAIASNPGTCNYGIMTKGSTVTNGYLKTPLPHLTTDFTVAAWIYPTNINYVGSRIFADDTGSRGYGLSIDDGAGHLRFYSRGISPVILDSTYTLANNTWYFVAAVADITNKIRTIYVFDSSGNLKNTTKDSSPFTGTWTTDSGTVNIGSTESYFFQGGLDEVQVYKAALSQAALAVLATQTHACTVVTGPDHIQITHNGNGLTCTPETLTVTACTDAACVAKYTASPVSGNVTWSGNPGGAIPFNISSGGTTTVSLAVTKAQSVTLGTSSVSPVASNTTTCSSPSNNCSLQFSDAGFIFSASPASASSPNGTNSPIPAQVAGTANGISGLSPVTYYLQAVQASPYPMACQAALKNTTQNINFGYQCNDPTSCYTSSSQMSVNGGTPTYVASNNNGSMGNSTLVSMTFDQYGNAPFTFIYNDVGKVTLFANTIVNSATLTGSTSPFVVKPYNFSVIPCATTSGGVCTIVPTDPGLTGGGAIFTTAGKTFNATLTALTYGQTPALSFGLGSNNGSESVSLTHTLQAPTGGDDPSLGGTTTLYRNSFINGSATVTDLTWGEVGVIMLTATNNTFFGNTVATTGTSGNVGRFIPDHFDTSIVRIGTSPAFVPMSCPSGLTCPTTYNGMVYSGQPLSVTVSARNATYCVGSTPDVCTTQNYQGSFAKTVTLQAWDALGSSGIQNPPGSGTFTNNAVSSGFSAGVVTTATPTYAFPAVATPPTNIFVRAVDTDNVSSLRATPANSVEAGVTVASGRIKISNASGSQLLSLPISLTAQYCSSVVNGYCTYTTSATDNNSVLATGNIVPCSMCTSTPWQNPSYYQRKSGDTWTTSVSALPNTCNGVSITAGTACNGTWATTLTKPSGTFTGRGSVPIYTNAPTYLPSTAGLATFGVYTGNKNLIYMRENY